MKNEKSKCKDEKCPFHGTLRVRGRSFVGKVKKIYNKRAVVEFERFVYHPKYERYSKARTRLHARIPECLSDKINLNSTVKVSECRPISKIIHFVVVEKLK